MDLLSEEQRLIYDMEDAGSRLVELSRFSGTESLPMLTRVLVDVGENIAVSERYFGQVQRYRALGVREKSAQIAEERAEEYNRAAISGLSNTVPLIDDHLRPELEATGSSVDAELVDRLQENLRQDVLADVRMSASRIERFDHAARECFDVARDAGSLGLCGLISSKVSELEQLRQSPDRGMTHQSPAPLAIGLGLIIVASAIITGVECANRAGAGCRTAEVIMIFGKYLMGGILIAGAILGGGSGDEPPRRPL
jgi:hypothetical protein